MKKEKTALQQLIDNIDKQILSNKYYRMSPRLREGAAIVKSMAQKLIATERKQIEDAKNSQKEDYRGMATFVRDGKQYFNQTFETP